ESQLNAGTALTSRGNFQEAIPHLLAARGQVRNEYAAGFNLALCYVATRQFPQAIEILKNLRGVGTDAANVQNLLAQAYVGNSQPDEAYAALERAAAVTPKNEKLYVFVADACRDSRDFDLGLKVVALGLRNLSRSARLRYERGLFLAALDEFDE